MQSMGYILLLLVSIFGAFGDICKSPRGRGPACSSLLSFGELNLQVNDSVGHGCFCDVRIAPGSERHSFYFLSVDVPGGIHKCGYGVDVIHTSSSLALRCRRTKSFLFSLYKDDAVRFHIRPDLQNRGKSPKFCLRVESRSVNRIVKLKINCTKLGISSFEPSSQSSTPNSPSSTTEAGSEICWTHENWLIFIGVATLVVLMFISIVILQTTIIKKKETRFKEILAKVKAEKRVPIVKIVPADRDDDQDTIPPDVSEDLNGNGSEHTFKLGIPSPEDSIPPIGGYKSPLDQTTTHRSQ